MVDPITMAMATAVAGKSAEKMTEQAQHALALIGSKIRDRLSKRSHGEIAVLDSAISGESEIEPLAQILDREFAADTSFRDEIKALWLQVAPEVADDGVSNSFVGTAKNVVQARDINGGLTLS